MKPNNKTPVEGYFRRTQQSVSRIVIFALLMTIGFVTLIASILQEQQQIIVGASVIILLSALLIWRYRKRQLIRVHLDNDILTIKGGGYHIQLKTPFRFQTGVERIRATRRKPEFHYVRMVLDVYGKPLVFEEKVPAGKRPPDLDEILGVSSALGIAELSSHKHYPGTLWSIIEYLSADESRSSQNQIERDIANLYRIGGQQLESNDYYSATQTFSEIIRLTPNSPNAYYNRGMAHFYHGQEYDKAIRDLTTALRLKPDFDKAYYLRGLVHRENENWAGLRDDCTNAIRLNPNDSNLYNQRGGASFRLHDYQSALADFDRAIQLDNRNPEPYHNRGLVKQQMGNLKGAFTDFHRALHVNPFFEPARRSLEVVKKEIN